MGHDVVSLVSEIRECLSKLAKLRGGAYVVVFDDEWKMKINYIKAAFINVSITIPEQRRALLGIVPNLSTFYDVFDRLQPRVLSLCNILKEFNDGETSRSTWSSTISEMALLFNESMSAQEGLNVDAAVAVAFCNVFITVFTWDSGTINELADNDSRKNFIQDKLNSTGSAMKLFYAFLLENSAGGMSIQFQYLLMDIKRIITALNNWGDAGNEWILKINNIDSAFKDVYTLVCQPARGSLPSSVKNLEKFCVAFCILQPSVASLCKVLKTSNDGNIESLEWEFIMNAMNSINSLSEAAYDGLDETEAVERVFCLVFRNTFTLNYTDIERQYNNSQPRKEFIQDRLKLTGRLMQQWFDSLPRNEWSGVQDLLDKIQGIVSALNS